MWGDPARAANLEPSDALSTLLLQVTGPAHIPWNDPRWQELLHGYNVWVHLESHSIQPACISMAKHAATSSNLAALSLHVARMLKDLVTSCRSETQTVGGGQKEEEQDKEMFTQTIALVGKARATAGALNLLRILAHYVVAEHHHGTLPLDEVFTYHNRDITERNRADRLAGHDLVHASLSFLSCMASPIANADLNYSTTTTMATPRNNSRVEHPWTAVPELYDTTNQCLQLVLVLLSTQLYQPMISSAQRQQQEQQQQWPMYEQQGNASSNSNYFMDYILVQAQERHARTAKPAIATYDSALGEPTATGTINENKKTIESLGDWTPQSVLEACLSWQLSRPAAPKRSIAFHHAELARSVVQTREKKVGPDGMYESHFVVMASRPKPIKQAHSSSDTTGSSTQLSSYSSYGKPPSRLLLDGVLVLSSSLILLPFRLMSLAFGLWGHSSSGTSYDEARKQLMQSTVKTRGGRTNDVLWLSDSPIADSGSALFLLLVHNYRTTGNDRGGSEGNPFRIELGQLGDERWQSGALDILPEVDPFSPTGANGDGHHSQFDSFVNQEERGLSKPLLNDDNGTFPSIRPHHLATNFESLLESFGDTVHTEVGALLLYTIMQSSPTFASFLVVRSDLDTLVMPLLRTLYFSSALRHYSPHAMRSRNGDSSILVTLKSCPFRSQSQLYVILILLLLFSQDSSFGPDAFRRTMIPSVAWYKERQLHDISLGSVLLLTLLRSITFNLNKLQDAFLLSNCCAVLMNLSHNIVNLHDYAAMRLVSVTVSALKRYSVLWAKSDTRNQEDHDITTPVGMYGEVSHTLLRVLRHCIGSKNIDRNLHLVYALVHHQSDFNVIASKKPCPIKKSELTSIQIVIDTASRLIQEDGDARTAPKAMAVLEKNMGHLKQAVAMSISSSIQEGGLDEGAQHDAGDYTFTYEEEADPEIFFIPYVWEVVVCVATASSIEWEKDKIQVFPLLEQTQDEEDEEGASMPSTGYSADASDMV